MGHCLEEEIFFLSVNVVYILVKHLNLGIGSLILITKAFKVCGIMNVSIPLLSLF